MNVRSGAVLNASSTAVHGEPNFCPRPCGHEQCRSLHKAPELVECTELPASHLIATRAREFVGHALCAWGCWPLLDRAVQVVSELATNAALHGCIQERTVARIYRDGPTIWFEIDDCSAAEPLIRLPGAALDQKADGWGLVIVDNLTDRFGWRGTLGGKTVFACWSLPESHVIPDPPKPI